MGKKLNKRDTVNAIKADPMVQFDICCKCGGAEISDGATMNDYGDPDTFEVICDECLDMTHVLVKVKRDGNGVRDERTEIAVSDTEQKLVDYCNMVLGMKIGEPEKFTWADYYLIEPSKIKIV